MNNVHKSSFVLAFVPVYVNMKNTLVKLGANISDVIKFTKICAPRHLVSFGIGLNKSGKFKKVNYISRTIKSAYIDKFKQEFPGTMLYIDSGGYQCGQGYMKKHEIPIFANVYSEFLNKYVDKYDWAFSLDVPPNDKIFDSWKEVSKINNKTYDIVINNVDNETRKKIIFVFHFRSPRIWNLWQTISDQYANMYGRYWSVGGVAGFSVRNRMPCWLYTLPLLKFIMMFKHEQKLNFHVLGDFSWTTILFSQLVKKFVKRHLNIDLTITYDATSIVTGNLRYRYMWKFRDDKVVDKIIFKKDFKNLNVTADKSHLDMSLELLYNFAASNNFPVLDTNDIDKDNSDSMIPEVGSYIVGQSIWEYWKIEKYCNDISDQLLDLYFDDKIDEFNNECNEVLRKLHGGKLSNHVKSRTAYPSTTLDILKHEKVEMCNNILNMLNDEFVFKHEVMTW